MAEHVILVAVVVEDDDREAAERYLHQVLPRPSLVDKIDSWWIAEDDRHDGSDLDSAVFVRPGHQLEARDSLRMEGLA